MFSNTLKHVFSWVKDIAKMSDETFLYKHTCVMINPMFVSVADKRRRVSLDSYGSLSIEQVKESTLIGDKNNLSSQTNTMKVIETTYHNDIGKMLCHKHFPEVFPIQGRITDCVYSYQHHRLITRWGTRNQWANLVDDLYNIHQSEKLPPRDNGTCINSYKYEDNPFELPNDYLW